MSRLLVGLILLYFSICTVWMKWTWDEGWSGILNWIRATAAAILLGSFVAALLFAFVVALLYSLLGVSIP